MFVQCDNVFWELRGMDSLSLGGDRWEAGIFLLRLVESLPLVG